MSDIKSTFKVASAGLFLAVISACGGGGNANPPTSGAAMSDELPAIVGAWDISTQSIDANDQALNDEKYLVVRSDGTITEFDFQGDEAGSGFNCYTSTSGQRTESIGELSFYYGSKSVTFSTAGEITTLATGTPRIGTTIRNITEKEVTKTTIAEQDLSPICTTAQLPYADANIATWRPAIFNQRIIPYYYNPGIDCPALTGTDDIGDIAGLWDVTTITGRNDPTSRIIVKSPAYVHISSNGEVTHYEPYDSYGLSGNECYYVQSGVALLSRKNDSEVTEVYYEDESCELTEKEFSVERFSDLPRTSDLMYITQVRYDLNGETYPARTARFPEMPSIDPTALTVCQ